MQLSRICSEPKIVGVNFDLLYNLNNLIVMNPKQYNLESASKVYVKAFVIFMFITLLSNPRLHSQSDYCGDYFPCMSSLGISEMSSLPIIYIKVDFHFVTETLIINGLATEVNFQCSYENDPYYAPDYVEAIIDAANDMLENPDQSNQTNADDLPDTRIRFILYDEPEDPCDAISIVGSFPSSFSNDDVIHVVFAGDNDGFAGAQNGSVINIKHLHQAVFQLGYTPAQCIGAGRLLVHEVGHYANLCHGFSYANLCPEMDPIDECGSDPDPTLPGCGSGYCSGCCTWNYSNNVMSYGNQTAMTFSQWAMYYYNMSQSAAVIVDGDIQSVCCIDPETEIPIEIEEDSYEEWNTPRYVDTDIEIRAGAILEITHGL